MKAGDLDRRITILALTVERDDFGGVVETWSEVATVWARYLPGAGNERFMAATTYAETQARFHIRWRGDVTPEYRLSYDGKEWDILSVNEIERREGLEIAAKARA